MPGCNRCNKCLKDIKGDFYVKTPHETFWFCEDCFWEVKTKIDTMTKGHDVEWEAMQAYVFAVKWPRFTVVVNREVDRLEKTIILENIGYGHLNVSECVWLVEVKPNQ